MFLNSYFIGLWVAAIFGWASWGGGALAAEPFHFAAMGDSPLLRQLFCGAHGHLCPDYLCLAGSPCRREDVRELEQRLAPPRSADRLDGLPGSPFPAATSAHLVERASAFLHHCADRDLFAEP